MHSLPILLLCCLALCFALPCVAAEGDPALAASASPATPASPVSVQLSPTDAMLKVEGELPVIRENGAASLCFTLPLGAENLRLQVPGQTIASWSMTPAPLTRTGTLSRRERDLKNELAEILQRLETIKARMALWQERAKSENFRFEDLAAIEQKLVETLPALQKELIALDRRQEEVEAELAELETAEGLGQRVRVALLGQVGEDRVRVQYSYTLPGCGWQPVYSFAADTEKDGSIGVRLMAEVWQRSGVDWHNAAVTLVTRGPGAREPRALPRWELAARPPAPTAALGARAREGNAGAAMMDMAMMEEAAPMRKEPKAKATNATVRLSAEGAYARWELEAQGLNEGRSRLLIVEDNWKAPLTWLARPASHAGSGQVWLTAKYELPAGEVWPDGRAEYSVDGQSVGTGQFRPQKGEAELFFGVDPRVSLSVTDDDKKRAESGFFGKRRNWSWAWTYTFKNLHKKPITVQVERPKPMVVDQKITVTLAGEPQARADEKEHKLIWSLPVSAGASASISHALTISAPEDMPFAPTLP